MFHPRTSSPETSSPVLLKPRWRFPIARLSVRWTFLARPCFSRSPCLSLTQSKSFYKLSSLFPGTLLTVNSLPSSKFWCAIKLTLYLSVTAILLLAVLSTAGRDFEHFYLKLPICGRFSSCCAIRLFSNPLREKVIAESLYRPQHIGELFFDLR